MKLKTFVIALTFATASALFLVPKTEAVPDRAACLSAQQECARNCQNAGGSDADREKVTTCLTECSRRYNECIRG
jgi:hypothetical protein